MVAKHILNKAHVYSEQEKAEFLANAEQTAKDLVKTKISDELKALLHEQDARRE